MNTNRYPCPLPLGMAALFAFLLVACGRAPTPSIPAPEPTPALTSAARPSATSTATPITPTETPQPTPEPRTLKICMGAEPDTLFVYAGAMHAMNNVLAAIYDGPIDTNGYAYQPVILEKLPSLADGDARIEPVAVAAGDRVYNDAGDAVRLSVGEKVRPYGCTRPDCSVIWGGGPLEMAQLSADFTLLEGLRWSDGEPLTARDSNFAYSVANQCTGDSACGSFRVPLPMDSRTIERTAAYSVLDERTTRWTGVPGYLDAQYATNFFFPLPQHQLRGVAPQEMDESEMTARKPLGWGPYVLERWIHGDRITLSRKEQEEVKEVARELLDTLKAERLVLDWRKNQQTRAGVQLAIEEILDGLPEEYDAELYRLKCRMVYQHVLDSYFGEDKSIYSMAV